MTKVLVVEDEPAILESLGFVLERDGFSPVLAGSLQCANAALLSDVFALVVLDLMLPDGSGFEFLDAIRSNGVTEPAVIVLSSRDSETDRIKALEMGADDYVTKPFSTREVVARVKAVLRRTTRLETQAGEDSLIQVNKTTRKATVGDLLLDLTRVEFDLLALFLEERGRAFSRAEIIDRIWGNGFALSDRTIDSHIKALRRKLVDSGGEAGFIETVRGIGYRSHEPSPRP